MGGFRWGAAIVKLLALETSGMVASTAIWADDMLAGEMYLDGQLTHSQTAMPMIERVLEMTGYSPEDMDAFVVNVGPGSFTGIRIGVSCINGLAMGCKKSVIAVDSLSALAVNAMSFDGIISAIIDARGDQIYAGNFLWQDEKLVKIGELYAQDIGQWLMMMPDGGKIAFVGDGALKHREQIASCFAECAFFLPTFSNRNRAAALAFLALGKMDQMEKQVSPVYLRKPQAQKLKEEREKLAEQ